MVEAEPRRAHRADRDVGVRMGCAAVAFSSLICDYYGIDDVYLSVPTVLGRGGVVRTLRLAMSAEEASGLRHSAELLRATIDTLELDPR